jgi:hypothetical protein
MAEGQASGEYITSLYFPIIRNINTEVMQLFEEPQPAVWLRLHTDISCL